jgi:NitT/TauT family transport system permease protein
MTKGERSIRPLSFFLRSKNMIDRMFRLRGELDKKSSTTVFYIGSFFILFMWWVITTFTKINPTILPSPIRVLASFKELHFEDALVRNTIYSMKLNILGYLEAVLIAIPIGFVIGLFPLFREMFRRDLDAIRFIPLTAITGLFIAWFGIEDNMKIQFLAFGILVYLLPVVVQRIQEVEDVYVQTVQTLSINQLHIVKKVFIPAVLSKVFDDIRVLVAISWTYIIVAEMVNKTAGIGGMAFLAARQSRVDKVFAILIVIIIIGIIQDKIFMWMDKAFFPFKYKEGK